MANLASAGIGRRYTKILLSLAAAGPLDSDKSRADVLQVR